MTKKILTIIPESHNDPIGKEYINSNLHNIGVIFIEYESKITDSSQLHNVNNGIASAHDIHALAGVVSDTQQQSQNQWFREINEYNKQNPHKVKIIAVDKNSDTEKSEVSASSDMSQRNHTMVQNIIESGVTGTLLVGGTHVKGICENLLDKDKNINIDIKIPVDVMQSSSQKQLINELFGKGGDPRGNISDLVEAGQIKCTKVYFNREKQQVVKETGIDDFLGKNSVKTKTLNMPKLHYNDLNKGISQVPLSLAQINKVIPTGSDPHYPSKKSTYIIQEPEGKIHKELGFKTKIEDLDKALSKKSLSKMQEIKHTA